MRVTVASTTTTAAPTQSRVLRRTATPANLAMINRLPVRTLRAARTDVERPAGISAGRSATRWAWSDGLGAVHGPRGGLLAHPEHDLRGLEGEARLEVGLELGVGLLLL